MSTSENTITASPAAALAERPVVSVVIPCLNEAETIAICVARRGARSSETASAAR